MTSILTQVDSRPPKFGRGTTKQHLKKTRQESNDVNINQSRFKIAQIWPWDSQAAIKKFRQDNNDVNINQSWYYETLILTKVGSRSYSDVD